MNLIYYWTWDGLASSGDQGRKGLNYNCWQQSVRPDDGKPTSSTLEFLPGTSVSGPGILHKKIFSVLAKISPRSEGKVLREKNTMHLG